MHPRHVAQALHERSSLNLFVVLPQASRAQIDELLDAPIDGYFDEDEEDFSQVLREILAAIQHKAATPIRRHPARLRNQLQGRLAYPRPLQR